MAAAIGISLLIVAAFALAFVLLGRSTPQPLFGDKLGVLEIKGVISESRPACEALDEFRRDDSVRAVVLRVDSPGGGVGASQEIYQEVKRTAKVKPVVCSMGGVAASGGYYIAAPCTKIVANPGTITGSIGVISTFPNLEGLFEKLGLKLQTIKTGSLKGAGSPERPLNEAERAMLTRMTQDIFDQFLGDVKTSRHLSPEAVKAVSESSIFSGRQALELGLVDQLGNFHDAVDLAAQLGGIPGRPTLVKPKEKTERWWRQLVKDEGQSLLRGLLEQAQSLSGPQFLYAPAAD
ncbi:MAG: signal peptide peptidase SppA [Pseudomonadota bacterium]